MANILFGIVRISSSLFKCNYLKKEKLFLNFLLHSWNLNQILNIFKKKMILIPNVFLKLQIVNELVKPLSWKGCFRTSLDSQRVNWCQTLLKYSWNYFYHIFWSLWGEMTWKISPLLKLEILGEFVNTLTADDKYPVRDCENFKFPIQRQLS